MAQYVASYSYTEDVGTSFHTFYNTEYKFGIGMTNIAYTNVTTGYIFPPNITGLYSTNGCGWDTNGLSTTRQVDTVEQLDTGAFTNGYSGTEMWSGAGPEFPDGYPAISMGYRTANVTLAYVTDGDPTNILSRVYEITVFDAKENGTIALDPSEAMVNGTNCNAEGKVYCTWSDCNTNIITVTLPTATNGNYKVSVGVMRPEIFLTKARFATVGDVNETVSEGDTLYSTNRVTDLTNSITVGEKVTVFCKFGTDPAVTPTNAPAITAWNWTIGGQTISNYVANTSSGTVHGPYDKDKQSCTYYWKAGTNAAVVKCDATVNGVAVPTLAYFDVVKPAINFSVTVGANATFDANYVPAGGGKAIHWGDADANGTVGFSYVYDRSAQTNWTVCQLITATRKKKVNGVWSTRSGTSVLDLLFPNNNDNDSPGKLVEGTAVTADDKFDVWLMYNPQTPGSIWIPVWRCSQFGWSGSAEDPNANGTWPAASATVRNDPGPFNVSATDEFPQWSINWNQTTYAP
jgi:hypothetical protein